VAANYQSPEIAFKALGRGANEYLLKPFGTREILDRINKITGRGKYDQIDENIDSMAANIQFVSNIEDMLNICLDQLASTLHLTDCLVALKSDNGFRVAAGRGYQPDPIGRTIRLSESAVESLAGNTIETTGCVQEIVSGLSLHGHRPFPTLMALEDPDNPDSIKGFVMGHGALVLEQEDLLEMERFLSQVNRELATLPDISAVKGIPARFEVESELRIPEVSRQELINTILREFDPYLVDEDDAFWIRLCLDEAIANAIIHGHNEPMERPSRSVLVKYLIGPGKLMFVVEDSGEGFDYKNIPDPTAEENLLNVSGRGIFIMRKVMDEVIYNGKGNQVTMVKNLNGRPMRPFVDLVELEKTF
jgi:serine/threonine-protein kinase RsbW